MPDRRPRPPAEYATIALAAIETSGVPALLAGQPAVVLERVARGGGETVWYWIDHHDSLQGLAAVLRPGSVISFYFDGRISEVDMDSEALARIVGITRRDGDAVVAVRTEGIELNASYISGQDDLDRWLADSGSLDRVFVGAFPARDNVSGEAVTLQLPDLDGIVRSHPH